MCHRVKLKYPNCLGVVIKNSRVRCVVESENAGWRMNYAVVEANKRAHSERGRRKTIETTGRVGGGIKKESKRFHGRFAARRMFASLAPRR